MQRGRCFFRLKPLVVVQILLVHSGEPRKGSAREGMWAPDCSSQKESQ